MRTTLRWWSPGIVVVPGRGDARFQPLSVDDMAVAIERCVVDPERAHATYELGGPRWMTYREILDAVMAATGMRRWKLGLPVSLLAAVTALTDRILPIFPVSHDQVGSLARPNSTDLDAFERAFGARPRAVDLSYLGRPDPSGSTLATYYVSRSSERCMSGTNDPGLLVLVSLAAGPRHGHAILVDVRDFAGVRLGPGTLYGAIGRLEADGLIEPMELDGRRRPYRLTSARAHGYSPVVSTA